MKYLYHGSTTQNIKQLDPRKRYTPRGIDYSAIYATPLPAYAASHSFPWSTKEGINVNVIDDMVVISVPKNLQERLQVPISIYKISSEGFEHTKEEDTGYTWHTKKSVDIIEETKYPSVEVALKELGASLDYF